MANNSFLTFLTKSDNGQYQQNYFQCNNKRCVNYKQVCDLIDDCGDMSDEINCTNHMICKDTAKSKKRQFISLSQKCDGIYDCFDLSDECNDECGKEILENRALKIICWFMGVLAMIFNAYSLISGLIYINEISSANLLTTKVLVSVISFGDFLIGIYLMALSVYDSVIYRGEFCSHQDEWLTGTTCAVLGVISTVGSQASLFAMTLLSVSRMNGITCRPMTGPTEIDGKTVCRGISIMIAVLITSFVVALVPLIPHLEDYFVQGMYYDPEYKLFIGFPNKERHVNVLRAYYEHNTTNNLTNVTTSMSWQDIGEKVDGMFSRQYGNLARRAVHFYGNDGLCLFKYFVRSDDARRSRQATSHLEVDTGDVVVWTILVLNLFCFVLITVSYALVIVIAKQSSERSGQHVNPDRINYQRKIQNKITIIVITDFLCWVPFIIISGLHNLKIIDATKWYATLAMIVLPLNSVINPLIYDENLRQAITGTISIFLKNRSKGRLQTHSSDVTVNKTRETNYSTDPELIEMKRIGRLGTCKISS